MLAPLWSWLAPERGCCAEEQDLWRRALELLAPEHPALGRRGEARKALGDFLIMAPGPFTEAQLLAVDAAYAAVAVPGVGLGELRGLELWHPRCRVVVWRGDITCLAADAVVNAANEESRVD